MNDTTHTQQGNIKYKPIFTPTPAQYFEMKNIMKQNILTLSALDLEETKQLLLAASHDTLFPPSSSSSSSMAASSSSSTAAAGLALASAAAASSSPGSPYSASQEIEDVEERLLSVIYERTGGCPGMVLKFAQVLLQTKVIQLSSAGVLHFRLPPSAAAVSPSSAGNEALVPVPWNILRVTMSHLDRLTPTQAFIIKVPSNLFSRFIFFLSLLFSCCLLLLLFLFVLLGDG